MKALHLGKKKKNKNYEQYSWRRNKQLMKAHSLPHNQKYQNGKTN